VSTSTGNPVAPLLEVLPHSRDIGLHVVLARASGGAGWFRRPSCRQLSDARQQSAGLPAGHRLTICQGRTATCSRPCSHPASLLVTSAVLPGVPPSLPGRGLPCDDSKQAAGCAGHTGERRAAPFAGPMDYL